MKCGRNHAMREVKNSKFKIPESRFKIQDSRFKIGDSRFKIQDSRLQIADSRFKIPDFQIAESRFQIADSRFKIQDSVSHIAESRIGSLGSGIWNVESGIVLFNGFIYFHRKENQSWPTLASKTCPFGTQPLTSPLTFMTSRTRFSLPAGAVSEIRSNAPRSQSLITSPKALS